MTRILLLFALPLAACSPEVAPPGLAGSYSGESRDRLCIGGEVEERRAGLIVYGASDPNCSASGRLEKADTGLSLIPAGDRECRIPLSVQRNVVTIGQVPATCSYYCGPGATMTGKSFTKDAATTPVTDFAGDPLC